MTYEKDRYEWGVGEEAEYIAFNPIYDPEGTTWGLADDITGYNTTTGQPPRRAQIITASRMSRAWRIRGWSTPRRPAVSTMTTS